MKNKLYLTKTQIIFLVDTVLEHYKTTTKPYSWNEKVRVKVILYKLIKALKPHSKTVYRKKIDKITAARTYIKK